MTAQDYLDARDRHRLTVEEFLLLDREGAFGDRHAELIGGDVWYMSPKHLPHARITGEIYYHARLALEAGGSKLFALTDISVRLSDHDTLDPDVAITEAVEGDGVLPKAAVRLLVEVSDSTLAKDLSLKAEIYSTAGIPEYWVVDIGGRVIHQMWVPCNAGYAEKRIVPFGQATASETIPELTIATNFH
jgi:Uma2 family endonuclease